MGFSSPQPSLSPHAQILLNWICFSQKWWLLSHLATAEGDSGAFGKKAASPWQLWQGHRGTSGGHVGSKVVGCCFPSGLFQGHRNCANECAKSVWVGEVSYRMWGLVAGLFLKRQGEAGLLFLVMNLEQIVFNTLGPDFWVWAEPMWNKAHKLLFFQCKKVSEQTFAFALPWHKAITFFFDSIRVFLKNR